MIWDRIEVSWRDFKGNIKEKWDDLTDGEPETVASKRKHLVDRLYDLYGWESTESKKAVDHERSELERYRAGAASRPATISSPPTT